MIKAAVFDLDQTLIDFCSMKYKCIEAATEAMIRAGLSLSKEKSIESIYAIYDKEGMEDQFILNKFLEKEFGEVDYKILVIGVLAYRKAKGNIIPYPGVLKTLTQLLSLGIKLAILTDAPKFQAYMRLIEYHLEDHFNEVIAFEDTGKHKPHPDPFKLVISKLKLPSDNILMVGDRVDKDMLGGRSAGMITCFAEYSNKNFIYNKDIDNLIDYKLSSFKDLINIVKTVNHD